MGRFVAFGEAMMRLSPPNRELLFQSPKLDVWIGGAESNVATQLARLGHEVAMATAFPDNALGDAAVAFLRGHGIDTRGVLRRGARMGLYFVTVGAGLRPSDVLYDRAGSAFATTPVEEWDWDATLAGADMLHMSGITAALGPNGTATAIAAAEAADRLGVPISFDGNYRARLWEAWDSDPKTTLKALIGHAEILFGNHRDISLVLGREFSGEGSNRRREAAQAAFDAFPKLKLIASTARHADDADRNRISARIDTREEAVQTDEVLITGIVDRIGAGDAFAAGVHHGLRSGLSLHEAAATGVAVTALKHSLPGDAALFKQADIDNFLAGSFDVRR